MPTRPTQDERAPRAENIAFGAALRRAIRAAGMSERAVAAALADGEWGNAMALQRRINRACNGEWALEVDLAAAIAVVVGVSLADIIDAAAIGGAGRGTGLSLDAAIDIDPTISWRDKQVLRATVAAMRAAPLTQPASGGVLAFERMLEAVPGLSAARRRTLARAIDQAAKDDARPPEEGPVKRPRRRTAPTSD